MPAWFDTEHLEPMSKEELIELAKLYARLLLTIDGLWFLQAEHSLGLDKAIEYDEQVWRQFGAIEAKRLKKFLSIDSVSSLETICKLALVSPMWLSVKPRAEIRDGKCYLSVTDCHPQKARIRNGLGEFPCKSVGTAYFEGFAAALDPDVKFRCVCCPPARTYSTPTPAPSLS